MYLLANLAPVADGDGHEANQPDAAAASVQQAVLELQRRCEGDRGCFGMGSCRCRRQKRQPRANLEAEIRALRETITRLTDDREAPSGLI